MNKRGIALILSLLLIVVLVILLNSFFIKAINENNAVKRYVHSVKAFWAAEAGIAEAIDNLPVASGGPLSLGGCSYQWTTLPHNPAMIGLSYYYDVQSTGSVVLPGVDVNRRVNAVVSTGAVDPSKFKYGIDAANSLCFGGNCSGQASNYLDPPDCNGVPCWSENDSTIDFTNLFGYTQSDVSAIAAHHTGDNFMSETGGGAVSGVTWVDVDAGDTLNINGDAIGSGVLIIAGNAQIEGTYQFRGIIYVLGTLTARGTMDIYGSTIVASSAGVDTINGTPKFHYDVVAIRDALEDLANNFVSIVSWKEGT